MRPDDVSVASAETKRVSNVVSEPKIVRCTLVSIWADCGSVTFGTNNSLLFPSCLEKSRPRALKTTIVDLGALKDIEGLLKFLLEK